MRIGRNKTGAAGHIKRNTQGTSNEISFSVLDSMKGPDNEDDGASPLGRISLFTLGPKRPSSTPSKDPSLPEKYTTSAHAAPTRPSWEFTDTEVKARRSRRKRSRRLVVGIIAIVCIIGLGFGATIGISRYQQMQERAQSLTAQIADAKEQVQVAEGFMQLVETSFATPLADLDPTALNTQLDDWSQRQNSIATKLRATKTSIERIQEMSSGAELERANNAIGMINAIIKAMEAGHEALTEVAQAADSYAQAEAFLSHAMEGDSLAREAVSRDLTDDATAQEAISTSNAAIDEFVAARAAVESVQTSAADLIQRSGAFDQSAADMLEPFVDYANLRTEAQGFAIKADEGYLNLSSQQMTEANSQYNATEEKAANLIAEQRGAYPTDIVQQAYDAVIPTSESVLSWQTEHARVQQLYAEL